jgi:hypothetical protein
MKASIGIACGIKVSKTAKSFMNKKKIKQINVYLIYHDVSYIRFEPKRCKKK